MNIFSSFLLYPLKEIDSYYKRLNANPNSVCHNFLLVNTKYEGNYFRFCRMGQLSGMCVLAEFLNPSFSHRLGRSFTIILSDIVLLLSVLVLVLPGYQM